MRVSVIKEECIGCGVCAQICPEVFNDDDEGVSVVGLKEATGTGGSRQLPVACIVIED